MDELLDTFEDYGPPLGVDLVHLFLEKPVDVGIAPIDVGATRSDERFDPGGGVAEGTAADLDQVLEFLLGEPPVESGPLHGPELDPDADGMEVVDDGFADERARRVTEILSRVKAVRVTSLDEKSPGPDGIVRVPRRLPVELEARGDDAPDQFGKSQGLRLVHRGPVNGIVRGQAHSPVVPRRLRVPLVSEVDPLCRLTDVGLQRQPRGPPEILGQRTANRVGDVHLAALQRGQPRGLVRDRLQDKPLHVRRLSPVLIEGLEDELDARAERDEPVGASADRSLLEALVADLFDVFPGHDPAGAGGGRVERHEVRPRPLETNADTPRVRRLDGRHTLLQRLLRDAPVTLERELDVLGCDRVTVVELRPAAEDELVDEPIRGHAPRLGQARRHRLARHRLHERVVQRVEEHVRRDDP